MDNLMLPTVESLSPCLKETKMKHFHLPLTSEELARVSTEAALQEQWNFPLCFF